ncbi:hypothetical protein RZS08_47315, partial [Arthrospira platensis SPKY1]|nr:hypothetical protein [Arthrospira platensis SPKY1]
LKKKEDSALQTDFKTYITIGFQNQTIMKRFLSITLLAALTVSLLSCKKNVDPDKPLPDSQMESLSVPASFNWSTSKPATFKITALDNLGQAIKGAKFGVYTKDPVEGGSL